MPASFKLFTGTYLFLNNFLVMD
ncbi:unnamed protein product [Linum tenue]|uniref:Uncharacterized protein n=1 Tax=Linum tenue TaxID=586396 RepID=A0AAV0PLK2_9ROSI|nr:unnamed protein product [Linum tenue]